MQSPEKLAEHQELAEVLSGTDVMPEPYKWNPKNRRLEDWQRERLGRLNQRTWSIQGRLRRDLDAMLNPPNEKEVLAKIPLDHTKFFSSLEHSADRLAGYEKLLRAHSVSGTIESSEAVWQAMKDEGLKPDMMAFTAMLTCCARHGALDRMEEVKEELLAAGYTPDVVVFGVLVNGLALHGQTEKAAVLIESLAVPESAVRPNVVMYTVLIRGLLREGRIDRAWDAYNKMFQQGYQPDTITFNAMIQACSRRRETERAFSLFEFMKNIGAQPDTETYYQLMAACADRPDFYVRAFELFESAVGTGYRPNVFMFNRLLNVASKRADLNAALRLVAAMDSFRVKKDATTYGTVLAAIASTQEKEMHYELHDGRELSRTDRVQLAYQMLNEIKRDGIKVDTKLLNGMLITITRAGFLKRSLQFFSTAYAEHGCEHDALSYFAMVRAYCLTKRVDLALDMMEQLRLSGRKPIEATFHVLLRACGAARRWRTSAALMDEMRRHGYEPTDYDKKVGFVRKPEWEPAINWARDPDDMDAWKPQTEEDERVLATHPDVVLPPKKSTRNRKQR